MTANEKNERRARAAIWCAVAVAAASVVGQAEQAPAACSVAGQVRSGSAPLPGVSVVALLAGKVIGATSTEPDGRYRLALPPGTYDVRTELTGFAPVERPLTVGAEPCTIQTADVELTLLPRTPRATSGGVATGRPRFETLNVQTQQAAVVAETQEPEREAIDAAARLLLPPGFSTEAPTDAVAVSGNMASMDRGMMGDRFAAIGRGEIDPVTGELAPGAAPEGARGQGPGMGGRGGRGGRGDFMIGGRAGRGRAYNIQSNYNYSGSPLDSAPYQLRPGNVPTDRSYNRQSYGVTVGGPVRLPGYDGQRRTTFMASYNGNRGDQLFDQYATVPTDAMRNGDFSALSRPVINPATGQPFDGNRIPAAAMNAGSVSLLRFVPLPNLDGDGRNFRYTTTTDTVSDTVNLRVTHNFTATAGGRGGRGGGGAAWAAAAVDAATRGRLWSSRRSCSTGATTTSRTTCFPRSADPTADRASALRCRSTSCGGG